MTSENLLIRNVPFFCENSSKIEGQFTLTSDQLSLEQKHNDIRIKPDSNIEISYQFQGSAKNSKYYLHGSWTAAIQLTCFQCMEYFDATLTDEQIKLRLLPEEESSLSYEEESLECRFDLLNLSSFLLSELLLAIPISPKHPQLCSSL